MVPPPLTTPPLMLVLIWIMTATLFIGGFLAVVIAVGQIWGKDMGYLVGGALCMVIAYVTMRPWLF